MRPHAEWNDGVTNSQIPEYRAYNDQYAAGYIGTLKKTGQYNKYIREVAMKPGGIRPVKQRSVIQGQLKQQSNTTGLHPNYSVVK